MAVAAAERPNGLVLEKLRDGGDPIGTLDRELGDRIEAGFLPDERDVGAMQRRDDREAAPGCQHLAGQERGGGVGNGVVDVEQIEVFPEGHIVLLAGQGQRIRIVLEERVVPGGVHLMEVDALDVFAKPERHRVRDEVDLVTAPGKVEPELRRERARPPVRWVASNADLHGTVLLSVTLAQAAAISAASSAGGRVASIANAGARS